MTFSWGAGGSVPTGSGGATAGSCSATASLTASILGYETFDGEVVGDMDPI